MSTAAPRHQLHRAASDSLVAMLRDHAEILPPPEQADAFGAIFDRFGDARVVLLGEATHGTAEFYNARAAITRRLIEHHGFTVVAVEADWPDARRIDRYVRHHAPDRARANPSSASPPGCSAISKCWRLPTGCAATTSISPKPQRPRSTGSTSTA